MLQQLQVMASWVPTLKAALEAEKPNSLFITFQLATVGADGFPHVRTCVFRGFLFDDHKTNILTFSTDMRLEKVEQLRHSDRFEAVFYFPATRLQFRFQGHAKMLTKDHHPLVTLPTHLHIDDEDISTCNSPNETEGSAEEAEEGLTFHTRAKPRVASLAMHLPETTASAFINTPIVYPLVSRLVLTHLKERVDSFTNLHELPLRLITPTPQEWLAEFTRQWSQLSRSTRSSYRKPSPGSSLDQEKRALLDKIARGVDGVKDSEGQARFAVVCLFVERVDSVKVGYSGETRWVYQKEENQDVWHEEEVCP